MRGEKKKRIRLIRSKIYCCHGLCTSNNTDRQDGVKMLPFPKPCAEYILWLVDNTKLHYTKQCPQCSKCLKWIHLCKRADSRLKELYDISKATYICSKHFVNGLGPTDIDPDPYPACTGEENKQKPLRQPPMERCDLSAPKNLRLTSSLNTAAEGQMSLIREIKTLPIVQEVSMDNVCKLQDGSRAADEISLYLRTLGHSLLDQNLTVAVGKESLTVSFNKGHLVEKSCEVNHKLDIRIFVLGKPIHGENAFWKKHSKMWSKDFDPVSFFKDLFLKWHVCQSSTDDHLVTQAKERARPSDAYTYDQITSSVRSVDCTLLSAKMVCFHCRKMVAALKTEFCKRSS